MKGAKKLKRSKFVAFVLIFALLFTVVDVAPVRAYTGDVTDLDKDDDGDIDYLDIAWEVFDVGMMIYDWWSESSQPAPAPKEEPKKEESSWWWPF